MKRILLILLTCCLTQITYSQTNTFPATGNVGIGLTNPLYKLYIDNAGFGAKQIRWRGSNGLYGYSYSDATGIGITNGDPYSELIYLNSNNKSISFYTNGSHKGIIDINGNFGIGTTSPSSLLEINKTEGALALSIKRGANYVASLGSGTTGTGTFGILSLFNNNAEGVRLFTYGDSWINGGNLGIGTTAPLTLLHLDTKIASKALTFQASQLTGRIYAMGINSYGSFFINDDTNNERLTITQSGNIGIGTTNPGNYKLAVEGTIGAREVKVTAEAWSDFVFHPTYKLRTLGEVEQFIKANNHLPEIPTEAEVKQNGVGLGEMNAKLLQKIEELTLYVIEQQKRIQELEKQNERISQLEEKIEKIANKQ